MDVDASGNFDATIGKDDKKKRQDPRQLFK